MTANPEVLRLARDGLGRFVSLVCVNAHDRCYLGGPCPWCEPKSSLRQSEKDNSDAD